MSILKSFPALPGPGNIPLCKVNEAYCCANAAQGKIRTFTNTTNKHPKINVARDIHHHRASNENASMYIEVSDNIYKKISSVYFTQGLKEALKVAALSYANRESNLFTLFATYAFIAVNSITSLNFWTKPLEASKTIACYSRTRNWGSGPVKCLAWHPHVTKIAVATLDDNVRIYNDEISYVAVLKCKVQENVSAISWRPCSVSEIAVACGQCVIVWTVDPNSTYSSNNIVVLKRLNHSPVTSVCWSPNGDLLISSSAADMSMIVWDVATDQSVPLTRIAGGGITFVSWSLDSTKVFAATSSIIFRVWDTKQPWQPERWCARGGRVVAACWGPNNALLFAAQGESVIYSLVSTGLLAGEQSSKAQPILDVAKVQLRSGDRVGGPILDMAWDPTGKYLAVLFEESPIVTIFCTTIIMMQQKISPCCFVCGTHGEAAITMAFQQNFSDGACLTIAWSTGRVQHFPIIYT